MNSLQHPTTNRIALYVGYPNLDRVALHRRDPRLKPAAGLRYWYLALALQEGSRVFRPELIRWWKHCGAPQANLYVILQQGDDVYWRRDGDYVVLFSPEALHTRVEQPIDGRERPLTELALSTREWHRALAEGVMHIAGAAPGNPERPPLREVAREVGRSRETVQRLLGRTRHPVLP